MKTLIFVPTKGPHRFRFGPRHWHDWVVQCRNAAALQRELPDAVVYVPSAVHITGYPTEYEYYQEELKRNGICWHPRWTTCILEAEGQETIEQCKLAFALAKRENAKLVVLGTLTHFLRLLYLCRGKGVTHRVAVGIPSPIEASTDTILAVLYPVLDILGYGKRVQQWAIRHRESGKHI